MANRKTKKAAPNIPQKFDQSNPPAVRTDPPPRLPNIFEICGSLAVLNAIAITVVLAYDVYSLLTPWLTFSVVLFLAFPFWWRFPRTRIWSRFHGITIRLVFTTIFFLTIIGCAYWEYGLAQRRAVEADRYLAPANDPYLEDQCSDNVPAGAMIVYFGKSTAYVSDAGITSRDASQPLLLTANLPVLTVERTGKGLYITAEIMSKDRQSAARIERNRLYSGGNHYSLQFRDASTIAVYDEHDEEIFYARYMNSYAVRVRGVFGISGKHTIIVSDAEMFVPALDQHIPKICIGPINGGYRF